MPRSRSAERRGRAPATPPAQPPKPASPSQSKPTNKPPHKPSKAKKDRPGPPPAVIVRPGFLAMGVALTSFGVRGDMKVEPLSDFPERFAHGARLWFAGEERAVQRSRMTEGYVFLKLTGIDTPEQVAALRGTFLEVPEAERAELQPDMFFQSDIIGMGVTTTDGRDLGTVIEFLPSAGNDVVVVRGPLGEVLIPLIEDVIDRIDVPNRRMIVDPMPGLLPDAQPPADDEPPTSPPAPPLKGEGRFGVATGAENDATAVGDYRHLGDNAPRSSSPPPLGEGPGERSAPPG